LWPIIFYFKNRIKNELKIELYFLIFLFNEKKLKIKNEYVQYSFNRHRLHKTIKKPTSQEFISLAFKASNLKFKSLLLKNQPENEIGLLKPGDLFSQVQLKHI